MNRRAYLVDLVRPRSLLEVVTSTYEDWRVQRTVRLGAALAYYAMFAVVPVVSLTLAVVSAVFSGIDTERALDDIADRLFDATPSDQFISSVAEQLDALEIGAGLGLLGVVSLLLAGSLVFMALADAAALIWQVPVRRGVATSIRRRLISFAIVLGVGAVAVVAVVLRWVGGLLNRFVPSDVVVLTVLAGAAERMVTLLVVAVVVALLFRVLVPTEVDWLPLLLGAVITALVLVVGTDVFGVYLDRVFATSLTGAAAGVLVFLLWTYSMAQVVLAGMHLTRTLDGRLHPIEAVPDA